MNIRRILIIILTVTAVLTSFVSCSRLNRFRGEAPVISKYVNEDYHFTLTRPSAFSEIVETPSEENADEYHIDLKKSETDLISIDIVYKKAQDLNEFAELYCPDKSRIIPLGTNHFAYDQRECPSYQKPAYYIYASTKRMLYIIKYEYEHGDENADDVVDSLTFEFDIYANLPKDNAFLSPPYYFASSRMWICVPADATVKFYPNPDTVPQVYVDEETGKVIRPLVSLYQQLIATADKYMLSAGMPFTSRYTAEALDAEGIDGQLTETIKEITDGKVINIKISDKSEKRESEKARYRIMNFSCLYNGNLCSGTVTAGYTTLGKYFEYVYVIADDANEAVFRNYDDMIHSIRFF